MKLYSDFALDRARQVAGDVVAVIIVMLSIVVAIIVHSAIAVLAIAGKNLEGAGNGLRQNMTEAARRLARVPFIGGGIRSPFDSASASAQSIADAGSGIQTAVTVTAVTVGILVALVPIVLVARFWIVRRIRFVRRASIARHLAARPGGMALLALRALTLIEPHRLYEVVPDPVGAWRVGDARAIHALAALSLRADGVRNRQ